MNDTLVKGQLVELKVRQAFVRFGFDVSIPDYNASRYDLLVDTGSEILRIQIKKALGISEKNKSFRITCASQNVRSKGNKRQPYTKDQIDYFATVWHDKIYLIPVEQTSLTKLLYEDSRSAQYLIENIFKGYHFLSDDELYNYTTSTAKSTTTYCEICGTPISYGSRFCKGCYNKYERKSNRPSREVLKIKIRSTPFTKIGQEYGVTDNAVRKWCDYYSLPRKKTEITQYSQEEWENI